MLLRHGRSASRGGLLQRRLPVRQHAAAELCRRARHLDAHVHTRQSRGRPGHHQDHYPVRSGALACAHCLSHEVSRFLHDVHVLDINMYPVVCIVSYWYCCLSRPVFDPSRRTHFMVHGWLGGRNSPWLQAHKDYVLDLVSLQSQRPNNASSANHYCSFFDFFASAPG